MLTPGQAHDSPSFEPLMEAGKVKRPSGRIKSRPKRVVGDRAYDSKANRAYLRRLGIRSTFPWKSNQQRRGPFDKAIYQERNRVERAINRLKQFRRERLATRSRPSTIERWSLSLLFCCGYSLQTRPSPSCIYEANLQHHSSFRKPANLEKLLLSATHMFL